MKQLQSLFAVLAFCLFTTNLACKAQNQQIETLYGTQLEGEAIDAFLEARMESLKIPGLSIAILNDARVVYHRVLGVTHAGTRNPVDEHTVFEAASMSKPILAYYVMTLVDEGLIDLDTPLYTYLPNYDLDYDKRYEKITARMVLTHQTGLPNWRFENRGQYLNLRFDPGTDFSYSGEAFEYLGNVVAHIKGETRLDLDWLIKEAVFEPLGMDKAHFVWNDYLKKNKAAGHNGGRANNRYQPLLPSMAGGLQTEAMSYAAFMTALMDEEGLTGNSYRELLTSQTTLPTSHNFVRNYNQTEWALGLAMEQTPMGYVYSHGGNNGDFQAHFEFNKEKRTGYVFLTNCDQGEALNAELKPFLRGEHLEAELAEMYEVAGRSLSKYEGDGREGVSMNAGSGDGFAWIKDRNFSQGTIEFELRGENRPGESFIGIAFHGVDENTYETIYFRPFNFVAEDATRRSSMVQYMSLPDYSWRMLRSSSPGVYEAEISTPPDPDDWFHTRIEVDEQQVSVFVNDIATPVLQVESLGGRKEGKIGLWVGSNSLGTFSNLKITDR